MYLILSKQVHKLTSIKGSRAITIELFEDLFHDVVLHHLLLGHQILLSDMATSIGFGGVALHAKIGLFPEPLLGLKTFEILRLSEDAPEILLGFLPVWQE